jgi:HMG (high mobility group) box
MKVYSYEPRKTSEGPGKRSKKEDAKVKGNKEEAEGNDNEKDAAFPPKAPEPALTPFLCFAGELLRKLKEDHPELNCAELGRKIGEAWQDRTPAEMAKYNTMARDEYVRFVAETAAYQAHQDERK